MGREIKFRAWMVEDEIMIHSDRICFEQFLPLKNLLNDNNDIQKIMQYTGLKDKNDVEIYEGDIVRDGSRLWKIEISPIYGIFFILSKGGHTRCYGDFASYLVDDFQVIGNIYENEDLLKG